MSKDFVDLATSDLRSLGLNEKWLQDIIVESPLILGIPNVYVRDKERSQPRAGRLDLLLETDNNDKRYEVEIQLGATDESHIIRTIEYWDLERKHYPQYEHCAVIVAEEITGRFFNVINLFNGFIPIIAINVTAIKQPDNKIGLVFTKVLDESTLATEDDKSAPQVDREWWIKNRGKVQTELAEHLCKKLNTKFRFTQSYVAVTDAKLFISSRKNRILLHYVNLPQKQDLDDEIEKSKLQYDYRRNSYWLYINNSSQIDKNIELLKKLLRFAKGETDWTGESPEQQHDLD